MTALPQRRELRGWLLGLLILTLLPLLISVTDPGDLGRAFGRGGATFPIFLLLDVLLIAVLGAAFLFGRDTTRLDRWTRSVWAVMLLALLGALWTAFAMLNYEISGLASRTMLIRLIVWLTLIVWCGFLLRLADFAAEGRGRWIGRVARFGLVQFMFLVVLEIAVGLVFPQGLISGTAWYAQGEPVPWREYVGWAGPVNGKWMVFSPGEFSIVAGTNERGLRDDPVSDQKPPGAFRVLLLGDSTTWANEVMLEDTYQVRLEALLSTETRPIEFIAGAMGGWGTDQQLEYFRREGCRYQPDLVLLQMSDNDVINNYQPFESTYWGEDRKPYYELDDDGALVLQNSPFSYVERATVPEPLQAAHGHLRIISRTYLVLTDLLGDRARPRDTTATINPRNPAEVFIPLHIPGETFPEQERAYALMDALLRELRREVEACGAELAAFVMPTLHTPDERHTLPGRVRDAYPDWDGYDAGYDWDFLLPEARMAALAEEAGIPVMPYERLVAAYDAYYAEHGTLVGFTWRWVAHFTPFGYATIAEEVAGWLEEEGLVPES